MHRHMRNYGSAKGVGVEKYNHQHDSSSFAIQCTARHPSHFTHRSLFHLHTLSAIRLISLTAPSFIYTRSAPRRMPAPTSATRTRHPITQPTVATRTPHPITQPSIPYPR